MHPGLLRIADRQGGVFTREQALADLLSGGDPLAPPLSALVANAVARGLRGRRPAGPTRAPRPGGVALTGRGPRRLPLHAALLWGFDLRGDEVLRTDALHFLGPADLDSRRLSGLLVHPSSLGTDAAVLHRGVWCTPTARTACDVVRLGAPIDGLATLDAALRGGTCDRRTLADACARLRGLRGVAQLGRLIPFADAGAESPMESRMRWRFLAGGSRRRGSRSR